MRTFVVTVLALIAVASVASAQTRTVAPSVTDVEAAEEGSGAAVQERAFDPRGNTAAQPERSEGNEDEGDLNGGDDGNNGTGGN
jgi:hypothetical protein